MYFLVMYWLIIQAQKTQKIFLSNSRKLPTSWRLGHTIDDVNSKLESAKQRAKGFVEPLAFFLLLFFFGGIIELVQMHDM